MANPEALSSPAYAQGYQTISEDVDLVALFGGPCRAIRVGQEGDLALTYSNGTTGTIWAVKEGETILIQASKIMATTTAGKISVYP